MGEGGRERDGEGEGGRKEGEERRVRSREGSLIHNREIETFALNLLLGKSLH